MGNVLNKLDASSEKEFDLDLENMKDIDSFYRYDRETFVRSATVMILLVCVPMTIYLIFKVIILYFRLDGYVDKILNRYDYRPPTPDFVWNKEHIT